MNILSVNYYVRINYYNITITIWCQFEYKICPYGVVVICASNRLCTGSSTEYMIFKLATSSIETNGSISTPSHCSTLVCKNGKTALVMTMP